jgi:hypothetical protein
MRGEVPGKDGKKGARLTPPGKENPAAAGPGGVKKTG